MNRDELDGFVKGADARAEAEAELKKANLMKSREARQERIRAGKADAFDCTSAEDIVCPHCGAWTAPEDSDFELSREIRNTIWHRLQCANCLRPLLMRAEVRYSFTTVSTER